MQLPLLKNSDYLPHLNPAYAAYLSEQQEFKAFMITGASTEELAEAIAKAIAKFKQENQLDNID